MVIANLEYFEIKKVQVQGGSGIGAYAYASGSAFGNKYSTVFVVTGAYSGAGTFKM